MGWASPHPPATLDSVQAVVGVVWDGLTTGTHRSHSCPWSIAKAGDTCNALYNPLFVCYANNLWGWSEPASPLRVWRGDLEGLCLSASFPESRTEMA